MNPIRIGVVPAALAAGVLLVGACSNETTKGQLMVSIQTDMAPPKDFDAIRLEVVVNGGLFFGSDYQVPAEQQMPATFAIVAGSTPGQVVDVRILARQNGTLRFLREAVTTVPSDHLAMLRMPVEWLCDGMVVDGASPTSSCPQGQTCVAGACTMSTLNSAALPTFDAAQVFGGSATPGIGGTCLDTVACFAGGYRAIPDASCTIPAPPAGKGTNVALVTPPGGDGICGPDACLIPLDQGDEGWQVAGGRLQLPTAACAKVSSGKALSIAVTTTCATKTPSIPTCGPWSAVSTIPATFDAGAPDGAIPPGALDGGLAESDSGSAPDTSTPDGTKDAGAVQAADAGSGTAFTCASFDSIALPCDPVTNTGCAKGEACAIVTPTSVGCVAASLNPGNTQGVNCCTTNSCANLILCADGYVCTEPSTGNGVCAKYCCTSTDCASLGVACQQEILTINTSVTSPDGGPATATFGVCQ
jgi:hypothetical protein